MSCSWCIRLSSFVIIILYLFLSVYSTYCVSSFKTNQSVHEINELEKMKTVRRYLRKINKPAKKTIKSPDGDLIDCVPFHKQPAFDNPLLKEKISMVPPKMSNSFNSTYTFQLWNANGEECLKGTIPIRRIREEDVLRATRIERFGMKHNSFSNDNRSTHQHAVGHSALGNYTRSKASLNIWAPYIQEAYEMSVSQLWVTAGSGDELNTLEAGWHVLPSEYGDNFTRFFVYWTSENYRNGCYNMACEGFIQTFSGLAVGSVVSSSFISTYNGPQHSLVLSIEKNQLDGNWQLLLHFDQGSVQVGFWPETILTHLRSSATRLDFGGEIVNLRNGGRHTRTEMGSGHFSREGLGKAAFVGNIEFEGHNNASLTLYASNPNCYDIRHTGRSEMGLSFFFGGPGRGGPRCR